jgi:hypothetical protein
MQIKEKIRSTEIEIIEEENNKIVFEINIEKYNEIVSQIDFEKSKTKDLQDKKFINRKKTLANYYVKKYNIARKYLPLIPQEKYNKVLSQIELETSKTKELQNKKFIHRKKALANYYVKKYNFTRKPLPLIPQEKYNRILYQICLEKIKTKDLQDKKFINRKKTLASYYVKKYDITTLEKIILLSLNNLKWMNLIKQLSLKKESLVAKKYAKFRWGLVYV